MLKPADPPGSLPMPDDERPVGDLVHELVENGKAYARAEVDLAKTMAASKVTAFKLPSILFASALLLLIGGVSALGVGLVAGLANLIGPVLAGILVFLAFAAIAGGLAWYGSTRLREDLTNG